jgi:hypothetical protein
MRDHQKESLDFEALSSKILKWDIRRWRVSTPWCLSCSARHFPEYPILLKGSLYRWECSLLQWSQDSRVSIVTGYRLDGRGSIPCRGRIFLFSTMSRLAPGPTQPLIQWVLGTIFPRVKWPGREADHSRPSSDEVKNGIAIPPLPNMFSWHSG